MAGADLRKIANKRKAAGATAVPENDQPQLVGDDRPENITDKPTGQSQLWSWISGQQSRKMLTWPSAFQVLVDIYRSRFPLNDIQIHPIPDPVKQLFKFLQ
jgi:hypothetical protein